ncbi:MAG: DMT family transporter [Chromatiales bacterium]|jgi:drug/metabolite transporter (DMT)-like permease|nr:DMT family transporter [Chromatiales bacterium]MBT6442360.1 DMT family transporter [Alphaproteobacteria bacterium]
MTETTLKGRASSAPGKAIVCMLLGSAFLISNDAVLKWMTGNYHVGQLLFCRGIFIGLPLAVLIWRAGGLKSLRVISPKGHAIRAILVIVGTFLFISSLKYLPIADAVAITFAGPLFVTALAPRLLGERVGWRRWMAVFAGFIGIIVIMRPGGGLIQWAALLPLAASLTGAFRDILTRHLSAKETTVSLLFYTSLAVTLAGLATTPFVWTPVPLADWGWFALSGLLVGGAHFLMIETFRFGEAALVAPFRYSGVIWAAVIGYFVWGDIPDSGTVAGISIVVVSGIYILHRQRVRKAT